MIVYADTSFLIALYSVETNSVTASRLAQQWRAPFALTPLHRLEAINALNLGRFRQTLNEPDYRSALRELEEDEQNGTLRPMLLLWNDVLEKAIRLGEQHTPHLGTRSLDILHVAAALVLNLNDFASFDHRQIQLARAAGLNVLT